MMASSNVVYSREACLDLSEFRRILIESGLGETRPIADDSRLAAMLAGSNLILTARLDQHDGCLVGLARCVTDFTWCCYLSELAVSTSAQGRGVGRGLLDEARRQLGSGVSLFLSSVPGAAAFYERAGMERLPDAFWYRRRH